MDEYLQWVVYGGLVCPQLLQKSSRVLEIFKTAALDCLMLPVFRDLVRSYAARIST